MLLRFIATILLVSCSLRHAVLIYYLKCIDIHNCICGKMIFFIVYNSTRVLANQQDHNVNIRKAPKIFQQRRRRSSLSSLNSKTSNNTFASLESGV
uniref:Secreted protein n=1 Tax=Arion vulgaris TaxID=1028688 RepID=A0A0B7AZH4_9EUPU